MSDSAKSSSDTRTSSTIERIYLPKKFNVTDSENKTESDSSKETQSGEESGSTCDFSEDICQSLTIKNCQDSSSNEDTEEKISISDDSIQVDFQQHVLGQSCEHHEKRNSICLNHIEEDLNYSIRRYIIHQQGNPYCQENTEIRDTDDKDSFYDDGERNDITSLGKSPGKKRPRSSSSSNDEEINISEASESSSSSAEDELDSESSQESTLTSNGSSESDGIDDLFLYEGAKISQNNFKGTLLALTQKHNLSSKAVDSILKLIRLTLPEENNCPNSSYTFDKSLGGISYSYVKYVTCWKCQNPLENDLCVNDNCNQRGANGKGQDSSIFYVINLLPQLKSLIKGEFTFIIRSFLFLL